MKTQAKIAAIAATQTGPANLNAYMAKVVKGESGQVTLDEILKSVSIDKYEAVAILKKSNIGKFITGRRGHSSRFVWGTAAIESPITSVSRKAKSGLGFLRVKAGGFVRDIPVDEMRLIEA